VGYWSAAVRAAASCSPSSFLVAGSVMACCGDGPWWPWPPAPLPSSPTAPDCSHGEVPAATSIPAGTDAAACAVGSPALPPVAVWVWVAVDVADRRVRVAPGEGRRHRRRREPDERGREHDAAAHREAAGHPAGRPPRGEQPVRAHDREQLQGARQGVGDPERLGRPRVVTEGHPDEARHRPHEDQAHVDQDHRAQQRAGRPQQYRDPEADLGPAREEEEGAVEARLAEVVGREREVDRGSTEQARRHRGPSDGHGVDAGRVLRGHGARRRGPGTLP